ncbi:MAG TPA: 50S ribosomal protein L9 [Acidimicrobiia bacterium]|nr:50S ribosomal protein L9 [Acidimicrobiia bacterium]
MKIVLRADVANLGNKGDLVDVAPGYARNYLVPKGLAMAATEGVMRQAESMRRSRQVRDMRDKEGAEAVARQLAATRIQITARSGEGGRLFGSVTSTDIAEAVEAQTGIHLDRRKLHIESLKTLGAHEIPIRLHSEVEVPLTIDVVSQ